MNQRCLYMISSCWRSDNFLPPKSFDKIGHMMLDQITALSSLKGWSIRINLIQAKDAKWVMELQLKTLKISAQMAYAKEQWKKNVIQGFIKGLFVKCFLLYYVQESSRLDVSHLRSCWTKATQIWSLILQNFLIILLKS